MSQKKEEAIQKVMTEFESMANLVLSQLDRLENFFQSGETNLPEKLREEFNANEKLIDQYEVKLSERIVNTIVLFQPVASDIRQLIACYRIIINLERIGDYAINIVDFFSEIKNLELYEQMIGAINPMLITSTQMVTKSLLSFIHHDKEYAIWTIKNDDMVDDMNRKLLKGMVSRSKSFDDKKKTLISFITIKDMMDNIERMADHATNIAEAAIYYMEGKDIRHHPLDNEMMNINQ